MYDPLVFFATSFDGSHPVPRLPFTRLAAYASAAAGAPRRSVTTTHFQEMPALLTILHTADWHLGQQFHGYDRDYEQGCFLDWLVTELERQRPDSLIVAGDVFDSINPSAQALRRYYRFLAGAHAALPQLQIVVTAGNHDAGARLEAPAGVLESLNIKVVGTVQRDALGRIDVEKFLIPLKDTEGVVRAIVMAVPFLRPSDVPQVPAGDAPYLDGIRELYRQVTAAARLMRSQQCPDSSLIAMGHCHLQGGEESRDSERRLVIGGAEALGADTFADDIAYVALGHLHKAQQLSGGRICYSGSPIPLSFTEAGYKHRVLRLTFEQDRLVDVGDIAIPQSVRLITIPKLKWVTNPEFAVETHGTGLQTRPDPSSSDLDGSGDPSYESRPPNTAMRRQPQAAAMEEILTDLEHLPADTLQPTEQYPFLEVRVLEVGPDPTRRKRIEQALEGKAVRLASIKLESTSLTAVPDDPLSPEEQVNLTTISPEDVFLRAHREKYKGLEADAALIEAFREILLLEVAAS